MEVGLLNHLILDEKLDKIVVRSGLRWVFNYFLPNFTLLI